MHTRSEEARVRIFALGCARAMWVAHGSKLVGAFLFVWAGLRLGADADADVVGFVSETVAFIVECAEDEHDGVVSAAHALKTAVEGATGESITDDV
jgi:U3 small nucleolar RNA-associated protein 10